MKELKLKYISEVINGEHLTKWNYDDIITLESQMGTGKTTFIINDLLNSMNDNEMMIYICNRKKLSRDIKIKLMEKFQLEIPSDLEEIDKIKVIKNVLILSYQAIAFNERIDLNMFKYIICDECHYFLSDSNFNNRTDIAFSKLIRTTYPKSIRLFISATMDEIRGAIVNGVYSGEWHNYNTSRDYSYLNPKYFQYDEDIVQLIKNDCTDDKWIVFVKSKAQGDKITEMLIEGKIDCVFSHSKQNTDSIVDEQFKQKVLICTKVFDNGININDENVKHIVVNATDKTTFLQEIGRVRVNIHNAREIDLYIPMTYPKTWSSYLNTTYTYKSEQINLYEADYDLFQKKYDKDYWKVYSDVLFLDENNNWKINHLGRARLIKDINFAEEMYKKLKKEKFDYISKQLEWLELEHTFNKNKLIQDVVDSNEVINLERYLESIVGKKLFKEEQQELSDLIINELVTVGKDVDYRTKTLKPSTMEFIIRDQLELPYVISKPKKETKGEMRNKRYIIVSEII